MTKGITTHRLCCDYCNKTVCYYSFKNTERKFMSELDNILCANCEAKINESDYLGV